jgi:hypothetical protein
MLLDNIDFLAESSRNKSNLNILKNSLRTKNISHAYMFCGSNIELLSRLALLFAASINCEQDGCAKCRVCENTLKGIHSNILTVEPEGNYITMDKVIEIQEFMSRSSYSAGYKICIIKEADLMNKTAANRILKTLEDPPDEKSIFIVITENIKRIIPTIISRCIIFEWDLINKEDLRSNIDAEALNRLVIDGIKKMIADKKNYSIPLDLSGNIIGFLKERMPAKDEESDRKLMELRNTGATDEAVKRFEKSLKTRWKRVQDKYFNLGINMVFDIITAWFEDMLSVRLGADKKSLNYPDSYDFIKDKAYFINDKRIYGCLKNIEKNRYYLKFSIYHELALDTIFLNLQASVSDIRAKV